MSNLDKLFDKDKPSKIQCLIRPNFVLEKAKRCEQQC